MKLINPPRQLSLFLGLGLSFLGFLHLGPPPLPAGEPPDSRLSHHTLDNGMEVFLIEDPIVPLSTIRITFRCGALSQTPETAGLFHLYEHMLFKGNKTYPDQTAFKTALKRLGVGSWNGGTSTEYVTYYFTLPSDKTEEGLQFWADAVQAPLLEEEELEAEKEVVLNEIRGYHNENSRIYSNGLTNSLFYRYPWRRDVSGPEENIRRADRQDMAEIRDKYYRPGNAALFISGNIDPDRILPAIEKIYGDWEKGEVPENERPAHPKLQERQELYYGDPEFYPGISQVQLSLRGPDVLDDPEATYAADVLLMLLQNPESSFRDRIYQAVPGLYNKEYIWTSYLTQRDGGKIGFGTYMTESEKGSVFERAQQFREAVAEELERMIDQPDYFSDEDFQVVKEKLADQKILERQVPSQFASILSFWWASADTDYYLSYRQQLEEVTREDLADYIREYILSQPELLSVKSHPQQISGDSIPKEFTPITRENAFWWNKEENQ